MAIKEVAESLEYVDVRTMGDLHAVLASPDRTQVVRRSWLSVRGLGSASWDYLVMLAGEDGVKADTMICRFVATAVGEPAVAPHRAKAAVEGAALVFEVEQAKLDRAIWCFTSGRQPRADRNQLPSGLSDRCA
ncbi:hypothetical protein D1871_02945 [Nakamurella silvestris]|nr:hypothetical protein D1871_02945 [Nakamurella silvestris]